MSEHPPIAHRPIAHHPIALSAPELGDRERAQLLDTFDAGWVSSAGPVVAGFEAAFAAEVGLKHAAALSSGTAALHLALHMLELGPDDAVIAPSLTFIGGVAPIVQAGAWPVFVDVDPISWTLDPALIRPAVTRARREGLHVCAIVPTDLYGQCCDIDAIRAEADALDVPVVLDSAEAVGATFNGRHAGHGARCAAYSFNGNKIMTTGGGGMLASDDGELIARARHLASQARLPAAHYEHAETGFNYRMTSLAAALGLAQLETLDERVSRRRAVFDHYRRRLADVPGLSFAPEAPGRRHTRWLTVIRLAPGTNSVTPERLRLALEAAGIESRPVWKPMHLQPAFRDAPMIGGAVSEALFAEGLCLPSGGGVGEAEVDRICDLILDVMAG